MPGLLPAPELPPGCTPTPTGLALPPATMAGTAGRAQTGCVDPAIMMASAWAACCALVSGFTGSACVRDAIAAGAPSAAELMDGRSCAAVVLKGAPRRAGVLEEACSGAGADEVVVRGAVTGLEAAAGASALPGVPTDAVRTAAAACCG